MQRKQGLLTANGVAASASANTPSSPASTGAMDDLLAKLRAAKPDTRDQRDRRRRARLKDRYAVRVASGQKMPDLSDMVKPRDGGAEGGPVPEIPEEFLSPTSDAGNSDGEGSDTPIARTKSRSSKKKSTSATNEANTGLPSPSLSPTQPSPTTTDLNNDEDDGITIASRAATLLEGLKNENMPSLSLSLSGGDPDDIGPGPDISVELARRALMPRENSIRVRRRREGAESERERRRARRKLASLNDGQGEVEGNPAGEIDSPVGDEGEAGLKLDGMTIPIVNIMQPSSPMVGEFDDAARQEEEAASPSKS